MTHTQMPVMAQYVVACASTGTTPESNVNEAMEAAAAAVEREGKSVLDALKDLHTHFGAGATGSGAAQANVVEGPPRLGKVRLLVIVGTTTASRCMYAWLHAPGFSPSL